MRKAMFVGLVLVAVVAAAVVWAAGGNTLETYESNDPVWTRPITVANFPDPQNVAGTVDVGNLPTDVDGNVKVTVQGGSTSTPQSMFLELLSSPLPMSANETFYSDVVDASGYTVVGVAINAVAMSTQAKAQWRWDAAQSFDWVAVEEAGACSFTAGPGNISRRLCAVRGPELRLSVFAYGNGTLESVQVLLTNDLVLP